MTAGELIREVEKREGAFELKFESEEVVIRFQLDRPAPSWLVRSLETQKVQLANLLLRRYFLEKWQPPKGAWLQ